MTILERLAEIERLAKELQEELDYEPKDLLKTLEEDIEV